MPKGIYVSAKKSRVNSKFMEKLAKKYAGKSMKQIRRTPVSLPADGATFQSIADFFTSTPARQRLFMRLYKIGYYARYAPLAVAIGAGSLATRNYRQKIILPNTKMPGSAWNVSMPNQYGGLWTYKKKSTSQNRKNKSNRRKPKKQLKPRKIKNRVVKSQFQIVDRQIKDLRKKVHVDLATHTYRSLASARSIATANQCTHTLVDINTGANVETVLANLRYYNPSVPGTLTTASGATGTFSRDIHFDNIYSHITLRNNYQVPCDLKVYLCKVKGHTSNDPVTLLGASDQIIGGSSSVNPMIFMTDIETLTQQWSVDCVKSVRLLPGHECVASHSEHKINYDPAHYDGNSDTYQKDFKSFVWVIRVEGVVAHDTTLDQQGNSGAGVDFIVYNKYVIKYDAGVSLNDIYYSDSRDSFTNGAVVSSMPVSDNIGYSVA